MTEANQYLQTLLTYYEEEVSGEYYFLGLRNHFEEREKLMALAKVEQYAARSVECLLAKYHLRSREVSVLKEEGENDVLVHAGLTWREFMTHIVENYPAYLDEFCALENIAPIEDRAALQQLTQHEVAAIDFARAELTGDCGSLNSLKNYMSQFQ